MKTALKFGALGALAYFAGDYLKTASFVTTMSPSLGRFMPYVGAAAVAALGHKLILKVA